MLRLLYPYIYKHTLLRFFALFCMAVRSLMAFVLIISYVTMN